MYFQSVSCVYFSLDKDKKSLVKKNSNCFFLISQDMNGMKNIQFIFFDEIDEGIIEKINSMAQDWLLDFSDYRFRKGVGIKGEIQRLHFKGKTSKYVEFYTYSKSKRRLKVDTNSVLQVPYEELKYIYPFVLSPDITEEGLKWNKSYIIFPYEYGKKYPVSEDKLRKEAPTLYNYLMSHKDELERESEYNKRIQQKKIFYGVIRVGKYTYHDCFVVIRDNTKLVAQVVRKLKTDWGEEKIPIFDNHVSYLSEDINGKPLTCEKAEKIKNVLNDPAVRKFVEGYFDSRSIGSRIPVRIETLIED